jgi:ubiquinone/menaquinone biosynthesis C-methylase UbiE
MFMNAKNLAFKRDCFDIAICGFMGWYDCFDFNRNLFKEPDTKIKEIWRTLKDGGRFVCCSWEVQEDVQWMEEIFIHHHPAILDDPVYLKHRPIGMAYEKADGYELIFRNGGFREIKTIKEEMAFVSTDKEEWWRQMQNLGWDDIFLNIKPNQLQVIKQAIFEELQPYQHADGLHFTKRVFFIIGVK